LPGAHDLPLWHEPGISGVSIDDRRMRTPLLHRNVSPSATDVTVQLKFDVVDGILLLNLCRGQPVSLGVSGGNLNVPAWSASSKTTVAAPQPIISLPLERTAYSGGTRTKWPIQMKARPAYAQLRMEV
jgi:hypothetical protein